MVLEKKIFDVGLAVKYGQGHPRVMIYTNFVKLHCLMLHAKFQSHRPFGSREEDFKDIAVYCHGGYLGHVAWTIYTNFGFPVLRLLYIKFGFDWPRGFRGDVQTL